MLALPQYSQQTRNVIHVGDALQVLRTLASGSVHCGVTSPPYFGLRAYGAGEHELGSEDSLADYLSNMTAVFREFRRVLRDDGVLFVNMGDSYSGSSNSGSDSPRVGGGKPYRIEGLNKNSGLSHKQLIGVPWRLAFALQDDGWTLRRDIVWHKPNPMPESVTDRPTKAHEYIFMFSKQARYWCDMDAVREAQDSSNPNPLGRNLRTVWTIATQPSSLNHFAMFPEAIPERCILMGCPRECCSVCGAGYARMVEDAIYIESGKRSEYPSATKTVQTLGFAASCDCKADTRPGVVLDSFGGMATTGLVARRLGRDYVMIELNPDYAVVACKRLADSDPYKATVHENGTQQLSLFSEAS